MKCFVLHPSGNREGVLFDDERETRLAAFYTPQEAKFQAAFKSIREAKR